MLAFIQYLSHYVQMSIRDTRNKLFEAITPQAALDTYEQHGREIANAISLSRLPITWPIFQTAARGKKGVGPAVLRGLRSLGDGYDGFVAERDKDFATSEPIIRSLTDLWRSAVATAKTSQSNEQKIKELALLLEMTDGGKIDPACDKPSQIGDQVGNAINGDIPWAYPLSNLVRIGWIDFGVRPAYRAIGLESAGSATSVSQAKTVIHDLHQGMTSAGLIDKHPRVRRALNAAGIGITIASGLDIMAKSESAYRELIGKSAPITWAEKIHTASQRTLLYLAGQDPTATGSEFSFDQETQTFGEFPAWHPTELPHSLN